MSIKKLLPYLLLNIAVSAVTMLAVILIWNAFHPVVKSTVGLDGLLTGAGEATLAALPPLDQKTVEIQSVFMPGEVDYEKVSLKNIGGEAVNLSGWSVNNSEGEQLILPALILYPDGAVDVYSRAGINTAVELYWNASEAIWRVGDTAILLDSAGDERSQFLIP
jgi:hypothetical protein